MTLERYVYAGTKRLRCGYTTGSCAALATQAACRMLLGEPTPERASLVTPNGVRVEADVLDAARAIDGTWARCAVRKDGGDDVDATDGLLVYSEVRFAREGEEPSAGGVVILGGEGVGRVTRPGLEQPVGEAAINSVPRTMIIEQVHVVCAGHDERPERPIVVTVSVPGGAEVAARTFNPQLGIEGGISILGTTGIVEPRSVAALVDSIELEVRQRAAEGARDLVIVPGNYGRDFVAAHLPQLEGVPLVSCSNYLGEALDFAARHGFERVLLVGHIGKLAKVAAGVMNTHSRVADCRCEAICAHAAMAGAFQEVAHQIMACATTEACLDVLDKAGLLAPVMASLTAAIADHVKRRAAGAYESAVVLFSQVRGELARSANADALIGRMVSGARH